MREPKWRIVISTYRVYADESHDSNRTRVFSVAGLYGNHKTIEETASQWEKRCNGIVFHATDCDSNQGDFRGFSNDENKKLYRDLTVLLADSKLLGFGAAVSLPDYYEAVGNDIAQQPYFFCFSEVIAYFAKMAYVSIPQGKVKFTFEHNLDVEYDAGSMYSYAMSLKEWPYQNYLDSDVSFGFKDNPRIQMADLLSRETMKHWDNQFGPIRRPHRQSFSALYRTGRFQFNFFGGGYFQDLIERSNSINAPRLREPYDRWLAANAKSDTVTHRIQYQTFCDREDRQRGLTPEVLSGDAPMPQ